MTKRAWYAFASSDLVGLGSRDIGSDQVSPGEYARNLSDQTHLLLFTPNSTPFDSEFRSKWPLLSNVFY